MHAYIHTYIHAYIHTYMHACMHTYIRTYARTYVHTYIHTYTHTYTHMCTYIYIYIYIYVYTYITCIDTYLYIHIHPANTAQPGSQAATQPGSRCAFLRADAQEAIPCLRYIDLSTSCAKSQWEDILAAGDNDPRVTNPPSSSLWLWALSPATDPTPRTCLGTYLEK